MSAGAKSWLRNGRLVVRPAQGRRIHAVASTLGTRVNLVCGRRLVGEWKVAGSGRGAGALVTCRPCLSELSWVGEAS